MSSGSKMVGRIVTLIIVATILGGVYFGDGIADQLKFRSYQPTESISQIATRSGMSEKGKFYFYVTKPELENAEQFNDDCKRSEKKSPILGCYRYETDSIHIFDIDNPELDGIKEVTAAHEMLHAVFARLSSNDQQRLELLLEAAYDRHKNPELEERLGYYERAQPGTRTEELHSIMGTEFSDLGAELEEHYRLYFTDRQAVLDLFEKYSAKFTAVEKEIDNLSTDLERRDKEIVSRSEVYEKNIAGLNSRIDQFNYRAESGYYTSANQFNADRRALNSEVHVLENERAAIQRMVDDYNRDVARYNELGTKYDELYKSLDSMEGLSGGVEKI